MNLESLRHASPLLLALVLVGGILGGLLVGYEPVGGDPDRMYRPLKSELARALRDGRLPFWSDRLGLGLPLVAESHVAAFYPPNLVLYRLLDVPTAYRLSMWLHHLGLVAATYFYARCLGIAPGGGTMSAIAFTLCGFQAIHSSHEPFYCLMPYLPLALGISERYLATGGLAWLAALPAALGLQWTLGHFQIQTWTAALVLLTALWRVAVDRRPPGRAVAVGLAVAWGAAMAAVQLGPSWQFARLVGQTRSAADDPMFFASPTIFYSFPPANWFEPALPRLVRELREGPEDPYWYGQRTTGFEAALYFGTAPLILAAIGAVARPSGRATRPWLVLIPAGLALATMPRWWPQGYLYLLTLPGVGYFRVPARYTLVPSLGVAILAGEGFDRAIPGGRFRAGVAAALAFGGVAAAGAASWSSRLDVHLRPSPFGIPAGFLWAAITWSIAMAVVLAWRADRVGRWAPLGAAAVELGILYYAGTTQWGWSVPLPEASPALLELARRGPGGPVGGPIANLPIRAGLASANPSTGFTHPPANRILARLQERLAHAASPEQVDARLLSLWLRRCRVTHLVDPTRASSSVGEEVVRLGDPALDRVAYRAPGERARRTWSIVRVDDPFPEARAAARARTAPTLAAVVARLSRSEDRDVAWFLAEDGIPDRPDARRAAVTAWDGAAATVEHDGPCDLVIGRTYDPGWLARVDDGPERPVLPADAGLLAVRLDGAGVHRVRLRYRTPRLSLWIAVSVAATITDLVASLAVAGRFFRRRDNNASTLDESLLRGRGPGELSV